MTIFVDGNVKVSNGDGIVVGRRGPDVTTGTEDALGSADPPVVDPEVLLAHAVAVIASIIKGRKTLPAKHKRMAQRFLLVFTRPTVRMSSKPCQTASAPLRPSPASEYQDNNHRDYD